MNQQALRDILQQTGAAAIAVSGGIDSLTLACIAVETCPDTQVFHALSPAVPEAATERVRRFAQERNWPLHIIDAGEFTDPDYLNNPVNRCFYCKSNLYAQIARNSDLPIFSGTNLDDLDDYRPGLIAAREQQVRHPYVEAQMSKADIRVAARELGLGEIAELSAAPCLSSRVTTGIKIVAKELHLIDRVEATLRNALGDIPIRCRRIPEGYQIQIDTETLQQMDEEQYQALQAKIHPLLQSESQLLPEIEPYTRGSAFVHDKVAAHEATHEETI